MPSKSFNVKFIYGFVILYYTYLNFTQAAFPLERDIAELLGVSQHKDWIIFMEKLARICFGDTKYKAVSSVIDVLKCVSKSYTEKCLLKRSGKCCLVRTYPNVLKYGYQDTGARPRHYIQIILHQKFSLNITVVQSNLPYRRGNIFRPARIIIAGKRVLGPQYPITFMHPNNTVVVAFDMLYGNDHVLIEYSVAQKVNVKDIRLRRSETMPFLWSSFVVRMFHLRVDVRARLVFDVIFCVLCKLIVYDGPNERLPIIMKINDTYTSEKVVASTFQVLVVIAEDLQQEKTMDFFPTYITTAVYNLTNDESREISFDNRTNCFGHSLSARLCVYTFYTSNLQKINFSLMSVQFTGIYSGKQTTAGLVLFHQHHGTTIKLFELSPGIEPNDLEIISTGETMHVAVFVYSIFASLSLQFSMSTTNCNVLLVSNDYISFSGYMTPADDNKRAFKIIYMDSDDCFQVQFISSPYKIDIILPQYRPTLLKIYKTSLLPYYPEGCRIHYHQAKYKPYTIYRNPDKYKEIKTIIHVINSFTVYTCKPMQYLKIRIKQLPCKLPCYYLTTNRHCSFPVPRDIRVNGTCNVCANRYILCTSMPLKGNISITIKIKSNMCLSVYLHLRAHEYTYGEPFMTLSIKRNNTIVTIPEFLDEPEITLTSEDCLIEIPTDALYSDAYHKSPKSEVTRHVMKDVVWNGGVYRPHLSELFQWDWETAAQSCLQADMTLLTIHSLTEYHFLTKTLLVTHDMLVLYVGPKREVISFCNCHRMTSIN